MCNACERPCHAVPRMAIGTAGAGVATTTAAAFLRARSKRGAPAAEAEAATVGWARRVGGPMLPRDRALPSWRGNAATVFLLDEEEVALVTGV
jgi:hypothetical protein